MHNFEARYRAIVEKRLEVKHPTLIHYATWETERDLIPEDIARDAVCWWLAGQLPEDWSVVFNYGSAFLKRRKVIDGVAWDTPVSVAGCSQAGIDYTDPADAILTAWEIVLGIKEKP